MVFTAGSLIGLLLVVVVLVVVVWATRVVLGSLTLPADVKQMVMVVVSVIVLIVFLVLILGRSGVAVVI